MTATNERLTTEAERGPHGHGEAFATDVDLAVRWLGGSVVAASDEAFGDKENLVRSEPARFEPGHYGNRGEIVDGWETRRRRTPGNDWAIVRLGAAGVISSIDVDTSYFTGNFPETCRIEATGRQGYPSPDELQGPATDWREIVARTPLRGDAHNVFPVDDGHRFTHVRISAFPDGGIARLRIHGRVVPDPRTFDGVTLDLAGVEQGGRVVASSDGFYTSAGSLIRPGRGRTMGEGWETRRRRDGGHDQVVIALGVPGFVRQLVVDTAHFKYNASESVAIAATEAESAPAADASTWRSLLDRTPLQPDTRHVFVLPDPAESRSTAGITAIRLDAYPDGGLSRLRVVGSISVDGRRALGLRWFNSLTPAEAREVVAPFADPSVVAGLVDARPLGPDWRDRVAVGDGDGRWLDDLARLLEGPAADSGRR
jgi:allantoicase